MSQGILRPQQFPSQNLITKVTIEVAIYRMGNRPDAKILGKWERKWKMAPGPKWPKNGRRNGKMDPKMGCLAIFPFRWQFFGHFGPGAIFHFLSHFSGIFASGRFPMLYMATSIAILKHDLNLHGHALGRSRRFQLRNPLNPLEP